MPDFAEHDFRPVILGGDITAYSLVRTFYEAYQVKSIVVNMTRSGGPLEGSSLCDHLFYDATRNGSRRFCSDPRCASRTHTADHRARQRAT